MNWLLSVQRDAPRWPYLVALSIAVLFGLMAASDAPSDALPYAIYGLLCVIQWRRPTLLGWSLVFAAFVSYATFVAFAYGNGNLSEYILFLFLGVAPAALLFLFRPPLASKKQTVAFTIICVVLCAGFAAAQVYQQATKKPLGEAVLIVFPEDVPAAAKQASLDGDFQIVTRMKDLPRQIQPLYREQDGNRFVMADRGRKFEATDFITDDSIPRRRLIFAAVSKDRCIVHYEAGGFGHSFHAEAFSLPDAKPLWYWLVGGAAGNVRDLRKRLTVDACCTVP